MHHIDSDKEIELRAFWRTDKPCRILAQKWGCSVANISQIARRLDLPTRRYRIGEIRSINCRDHRVYLSKEAAKRELTVSQLEEQLLEVIASDKLVAAVLDDEDRIAA